MYIAKAGEKVEGIWAIDNDRALAAKFREMGENMTAAFEMEGLKEIKEWEIIPGKFPASKTTVEMGMRGGRLSVDIEYYTSIKRETPTADKFVPPGKDEGFTQGTLMDLMPGIKLENIEQALGFNWVHEGVHIGTIISILNLMGAK